MNKPIQKYKLFKIFYILIYSNSPCVPLVFFFFFFFFFKVNNKNDLLFSNRKPEKGIKFLLDNKFVENSPNEVAKFLLNRPGFSKIKIGEYLGNLQKDFNMLVLE